jgi:hypothetical protein
MSAHKNGEKWQTREIISRLLLRSFQLSQKLAGSGWNCRRRVGPGKCPAVIPVVRDYVNPSWPRLDSYIWPHHEP